jgi:murein biosynthesis integral membrane protein MurJ
VSRWRAAALAVAVAMAATAMGAWQAPASAQQQEPEEPLAANLVEISSWVGPRDALRFRVSLSNRGAEPLSDLSVQVSVGDPVRFRSAFQALVANPESTPIGRRLETVQAPGVTLPPGTTHIVTSPPVQVPDLVGGDAPGAVLPLTLRAHAQSPDGLADASVRTFVVYLRGQVTNPLHASLLVPLHERSHRDSAGDYVDTNLAVQLGPQQPLGVMLAELAKPQSSWVTLMVDTLLAEEIRGMGGEWRVRRAGRTLRDVRPGSQESEAAQRARDLLSQAVSRTPAGAFPYADADLPALVRAGLDAEAPIPVQAGRQRFAREFRKEPDTALAWPVAGAIDAATLRTLAVTSAQTVVLDSGRFAPPANDDVTPNATIDLGPGAAQLRSALVPDPVLAEALGDQRAKDDPAAWAQRVLAETALVWLEQPGDGPVTRGILLAPAQHTWRPAPAFLRSLLRGLDGARWLSRQRAADLARQVPQGPDRRPRELLPYTAADAARGLPPSFLRNVAAMRARLTSFTRVVGLDYPPTDTYDRNLLLAGSSDWQGNQHRIRRASFVQSVNLGIRSVYQRVTIPKTRFTLSSRQGPIGIRVVNNSDQRLTLVIRVSSPKVDLPSGNQPLSPQFVVEPRSGKIQELQVSTRTPGTFPIQVEALTPDGAFPVASTEMILTSTAFSRFGLILTGGAAGFLLLWWSRRLGRHGGRPSRRRRRDDPDDDPDDEGGEGPPAGGPGGTAPDPVMAPDPSTGPGTPAAPGPGPPYQGERTAQLPGPGGGGPAVVAAELPGQGSGPGPPGGIAAGPPTAGEGPEAADEPEEPNLVRSTAVMAVGTLLSRLTGLLRVFVLVTTLGVAESRLHDTYNVANYTPNIIYELVLGGILSSIFVPLFVEVRRTRGQEAAWHVARSVMTVTIVVLGLIAVVTVLAAPWIIQLYVRGSDPAEQAQAQLVGGQLLAMFMPQIVFYGVGSVMTGLLNANRRFGVPMFAPILNNLVVIAVGITFALTVGDQVPQLDQVTTGQKLLLGLGTTAGVVAMTMVQWPFLRRLGFRYRPVWDLRDPTIRKMAGLSAYTIGYVVTTQLGYWIVPVLAYRVDGGPTAYNTAFIFFQLPHGVFAVSVMTALLPRMSEHALAKDWAAFRAEVSRGVRLTTVVLLPAAVGYFVLAGPIVQLLLVHGVVKEGSTSQELLTHVLMVFVIGLLPFSAMQLLQRAFYALQDTRTVFNLNVVAVAANVAVGVTLFLLLPTPWKVPGLAAGRAANYVLGSLLMLVALRRRVGRLDGRRVLSAVSRMLVASLVMGVVAAAVAATVSGQLGTGLAADFLAVTGAILAGLVTYVLAARLLKIEELRMLAGILGRRRARAAA